MGTRCDVWTAEWSGGHIYCCHDQPLALRCGGRRDTAAMGGLRLYGKLRAKRHLLEDSGLLHFCWRMSHLFRLTKRDCVDEDGTYARRLVFQELHAKGATRLDGWYGVAMGGVLSAQIALYI